MSSDLLMECGRNGWALAQACLFPGECKELWEGKLHLRKVASEVHGLIWKRFAEAAKHGL